MKIELIVTCSRMDYLPACLVGIDMQDHPDFSVLIISQNPDEETLKFVEEFCLNKHWDHTEMVGFDIESWISISSADGVVFLGNDQRFISVDALTRIDKMLEVYGSITGDVTALTVDEYFSQSKQPVSVPYATFIHRYYK